MARERQRREKMADARQMVGDGRSHGAAADDDDKAAADDGDVDGDGGDDDERATVAADEFSALTQLHVPHRVSGVDVRGRIDRGDMSGAQRRRDALQVLVTMRNNTLATYVSAEARGDSSDGDDEVKQSARLPAGSAAGHSIARAPCRTSKRTTRTKTASRCCN